MMVDAQYWIEQLQLAPHPEGGYFRQTYVAELTIPKEALPPRFHGARTASTAIYFLLEGGSFSALHRLASDEVWHFYKGSPLVVCVIEENGRYSEIVLGSDVSMGQTLQAVVKAGCWFGARPTVPDSYSLVGCTVAPGFDFADFELGKRAELFAQFPEHRQLIEKLTRE